LPSGRAALVTATQLCPALNYLHLYHILKMGPALVNAAYAVTGINFFH